MARKRLISPEFFTHADLYDAEAQSGLPLRLAFAGLWTACDRRGLFRWRPRELKLAILPYDPSDFGSVLDALEQGGFVRRYEVDGKAYGSIASFGEWQTFHPHEKPSDIPAPPTVRSEPTIVRSEPTKDRPKQSVTVTSTGTIAGTVPVVGTTPPLAVVRPVDPPPAKPPRAKQEPAPWMGRMAGAWTFGELAPGSATLLRPVIGAVGEDEAVRRLASYCEKVDPKYASLRDFVAKHATYAETAGRLAVDPRTGIPNAIGIAALKVRL